MTLHAVIIVATGVLVGGCGQTEPSRVPQTDVWPPSNGWAADLPQVTQGIVGEFGVLGLEVVPGQRFGGYSFSVGAQHLTLPAVPDERILLFVYRTMELARDEANRLGSDGNVRPESGVPRVHVDYASSMRFHYRDRIIAAYAGCDTTFRAAMETVFGAPIVETGGTTCWKPGSR